MEAKKKLKNYEELWIKIRDLIKSVTKKSDDCNENILKSNLIHMTSYL